MKNNFPIRLAAIDVGSNAIRFAVAEFSSPAEYSLIESERAPVRLGHEVFLTGRLSSSAVDAALLACARFRERIAALGAKRVGAVATSAVREASNGAEFLSAVKSRAGIELKTITGAEEARLIFLAVSNRVQLGTKPWLLADLGGGSIEVSLADRQGIKWSESHTMGSVRLLEELSSGGEDPGRFLSLLEEYVSTLRIHRGDIGDPKGMIATGGNIETLASVGKAEADRAGVLHLQMRDLGRVIELLSRMSYRRRVEEFGMREDRADVILPAAILYERIGRLASIDEIVVPCVGLREGLLLDMADGLRAGGPMPKMESQCWDSAMALGEKYRFDSSHGTNVAEMALSIFDQLKELHGLQAPARRVLMAAALLHDIGSFISNSGHHKHSLYLIANSPLMGLSPAEIKVAANVARYHRKGFPKPEHESYAGLTKKEKTTVLKLASILRLSDALDREHLQKVSSVRAVVRDGLVEIGAVSDGDLFLEDWSFKLKSDLFRKVFQRRVTLLRVPR